MPINSTKIITKYADIHIIAYRLYVDDFYSKHANQNYQPLNMLQFTQTQARFNNCNSYYDKAHNELRKQKLNKIYNA